MELIYAFRKCENCGNQGFQWGAQIGVSFICESCLRDAILKIEDRKTEAKGHD